MSGCKRISPLGDVVLCGEWCEIWTDASIISLFSVIELLSGKGNSLAIVTSELGLVGSRHSRHWKKAVPSSFHPR